MSKAESVFTAFLRGQLRMELRDVRFDADRNEHYAVIAPILVEGDTVVCELELSEVRIGQALTVQDSVSFVPVPGKLTE